VEEALAERVGFELSVRRRRSPPKQLRANATFPTESPRCRLFFTCAWAPAAVIRGADMAFFYHGVHTLQARLPTPASCQPHPQRAGKTSFLAQMPLVGPKGSNARILPSRP